MKKNLIITVLCILIAAIIVITGVLFVKSLKKDNDKPETPNDTTQQENTPTPEPKPVPEPEQNETTDNNNEEPKVDETENKNEQSGTNETKPPVNNAPPPDTNTQPEQNNTPAPVIVPENVSESYKDFSLTKGLDAKAAYDKLSSFLNSKYSILTNKQNKVSESFVPSDLVVPSGCQYQMERTAANALVELLSAAKSNGIYDLVLYSGYRTYASQKSKYETRTNKYLSQGYSRAEAEAKAGEYIAPPGASEHHTGLAADVSSSTIVNKYGYLSDEFDTTNSYRWMRDNCANYGFIIRYQKGKEGITGYSYEPWHIRYIGKEHAVACTALGITYEEYHNLIVKYCAQAKADAGV